jgi:Co/Zn/Cd efflux system component
MSERIQRFMVFYALVALVLVGVRFVTRDSDKLLSDLAKEHADLVSERAELELQLANLESPTRVRRWAFDNNMIPFSSSAALQLEFKGAKPQQRIEKPKQKLVVETKWQ